MTHLYEKEQILVQLSHDKYSRDETVRNCLGQFSECLHLPCVLSVVNHTLNCLANHLDNNNINEWGCVIFVVQLMIRKLPPTDEIVRIYRFVKSSKYFENYQELIFSENLCSFTRVSEPNDLRILRQFQESNFADNLSLERFSMNLAFSGQKYAEILSNIIIEHYYSTSMEVIRGFRKFGYPRKTPDKWSLEFYEYIYPENSQIFLAFNFEQFFPRDVFGVILSFIGPNLLKQFYE